MKILITERQLMELTRFEFEKDLDDVLGKLSQGGIESLTPDEKEFLQRVSGKLQGQNIKVGKPNPMGNSPEQPVNKPMVPAVGDEEDDDVMDDLDDYQEDETTDLHDMFMDLYPEDYSFNFGGKNWYVEKWDDRKRNELVLKVSSNDMSYTINAFKENNKIVIENQMGIGFTGTIEEFKIPKDEEGMYKFIDSFNKMLPTITKRISTMG